MPRKHKNKGTRWTNRSVKRRCKPGGKWKTLNGANAAIDRLAEAHPLNALGMRAYPCPTCAYFHIGRAGVWQ